MSKIDTTQLIFKTDKWFLLSFSAAYEIVGLNFYTKLKSTFVTSSRYNEIAFNGIKPNRHEPFAMVRQRDRGLIEVKDISEMLFDDEFATDLVIESVCVKALPLLTIPSFESMKERFEYTKAYSELIENSIMGSVIIQSPITDAHPNGEKIVFNSIFESVGNMLVMVSLGLFSLGVEYNTVAHKKKLLESTKYVDDMCEEIDAQKISDVDSLLKNIGLN